jgi:hypothetical protein
MSAVRELALDLARKLQRGEPLAEEFTEIERRWRTQGAAA